MGSLPTFARTAGPLNYHSGWPAAGNAFQRCSVWSVTDQDVAVARPVLVTCRGFEIASAAGDDVASIGPATAGMGTAYAALNRAWNVVTFSMSYNVAGAGAEAGAWDSTAYALPNHNHAHGDLARLLHWIYANAATYLFDTAAIVLALEGDAATVGLRTLAIDLASAFAASTEDQDKTAVAVAAAVLRDGCANWNVVPRTGDGSWWDAATVGDAAVDERKAMSAQHALGNLAEAGYNTAIRSTRARLAYTGDDDRPGDYDKDVVATDIALNSVWHGFAFRAQVDASDSAFTPSPSGGIPITRTLLEVEDESADGRTAAERSWSDFVFLAGAVADVPVEERVLRAVETALRGITRAAGFRTDVRGVYRIEEAPDQFHSWPVLLVEDLATDPEEEFSGLYHNGLRVRVTALVPRSPVSGLAVASIVGDIRKRIQESWAQLEAVAGPFAGLPVKNSKVTRWERGAGEWGGAETAGALVFLDIHYRDKEADPYAPPDPLPT